MDVTNPLEDERGVDLSQIRSLLRMSVAERARHMIDVANKLSAIRRSSKIVERPEGR